MRIVVLGGGVAGPVAALAAARRGHQVLLLDRDPAPGAGTSDRVFEEWRRPAVGQFQQPHNFLGLARSILRDDFPDVYRQLLAAGAGEVDQSTFLGSATRTEDQELATIACRRPVFDAVLRDRVADQPGIRSLTGVAAGLRVQPDRRPRVTGVELADGQLLDADLVVDAAGRNSPTAGWLATAGVPPWPRLETDCGLLYYSRHYRLRPGVGPLALASLLGGPRGDLGYLGYAVFIGDSDTFCLCVMAAVSDGRWRGLRDGDGYGRVAARLPGVADWVAVADPITPVLPMGRLRNLVRQSADPQAPEVLGLIPIEDARGHTNPTFAFGTSMAIWHAVTLAALLDTATDIGDLAAGFEGVVGADTMARFRAVSAEDADRLRVWSGEPLDPTDRTASPALFLRSVVYRVAPRDPELLRAVCRRVNAQDPVDQLGSDGALLDRAEWLYADLPPSPPPPRPEELLGALQG